MGIESTQTVKKSDARVMLMEKGIRTYVDDSNDRLSDLLYENRESIFENYDVVDDNFEIDEWTRFKTSW